MVFRNLVSCMVANMGLAKTMKEPFCPQKASPKQVAQKIWLDKNTLECKVDFGKRQICFHKGSCQDCPRVEVMKADFTYYEPYMNRCPNSLTVTHYDVRHKR
jgi:hypothetical protein